MGGRIEEQAEKMARQILASQPDSGIELVDVEYVRERDWYLRVYLDKPGGVDLDDCQNFSREFESILDRSNLITDGYILEVSSPGLDRVLKKERDFVRERGKTVDVSLYAPLDGQKNITGVLEGMSIDGLKLEDLAPIPRDKIAQVRLHLEF